jgi:mannitol/fructose-specific phosphotransferase system IIA component (Ntr-type)
MSEAIHKIISHIPRNDLPGDPQDIVRIVFRREQAMPTYLGKGLAVPHGRLDGIGRPILAFARSDEGVPVESSNEPAYLIFLLLTPSGMPRLQTRLLADIAGLFQSEYVTERLRKVKTPEEVIEAIRDAQEVSTDRSAARAAAGRASLPDKRNGHRWTQLSLFSHRNSSVDRSQVCTAISMIRKLVGCCKAPASEGANHDKSACLSGQMSSSALSEDGGRRAGWRSLLPNRR